MAQPYIGEIRMFAGTFAPVGWAFCEGQLVSISENEVLFQVIGTDYGGDGESTFALPDLRGRIPIHQGNGFAFSTSGGVETVTLSINQIPAHSHPLLAGGQAATDTTPAGSLMLAQSESLIYGTLPPFANLSTASVSPVGGSQPHENRQPFLCINYIISMFGLFPQP